MIAFTTVTEIFNNFKDHAPDIKVLNLILSTIPPIIEKTGLRTPEEIMEFILESSYEMLPFPVRMLVKKEVYVEVAQKHQTKIIELVAMKMLC